LPYFPETATIHCPYILQFLFLIFLFIISVCAQHWRLLGDGFPFPEVQPFLPRALPSFPARTVPQVELAAQFNFPGCFVHFYFNLQKVMVMREKLLNLNWYNDKSQYVLSRI
jgi:hypothetical protein